jgi:hypothetical protein
MHDKKTAAKAKRYGIQSVPAVVIDGKLADCCAGVRVGEVISHLASDRFMDKREAAEYCGAIYVDHPTNSNLPVFASTAMERSLPRNLPVGCAAER